MPGLLSKTAAARYTSLSRSMTHAWQIKAHGFVSDTPTPAKWSAMHCACKAPPQTSQACTSSE
eukprot:3646654-Pyramimonas_sp.AAC.1